MTSTSPGIFIGLGGNLPHPYHGAPDQVLRAVLPLLEQKGVNVVACSRLWHSAAWPNPEDPPFVNGVVRIVTVLVPGELLNVLKDLETSFGRAPGPRNAPRVLDLDILAYGDQILALNHLILPHPRLSERGFVLAPWHDIAPDWRHPATGLTVAQMLAALGSLDPDVLRPLAD